MKFMGLHEGERIFLPSFCVLRRVFMEDSPGGMGLRQLIFSSLRYLSVSKYAMEKLKTDLYNYNDVKTLIVI